MKKIFFIVILSILVAIMVLAQPISASAKVNTAHGGRSATWTIMVYLAADNNLDYYSELDIKEMMSVGSTKNVNIVVLWDRWNDPAHLYKVNKNELEELPHPILNGNELNMGDPKILKEFVDFSMKHFKADHYVLVLWDHGDDFRGFAWDYHTGVQGEVDFLTHQEIIDALSGFRLDILAFDGCVMSLIDVPYEYYYEKLNLGYMVGSEGYIPLYGLPYNTILSSLIDNPWITPSEFCKVIIDRYVEFYSSHGSQTTLSAIEINEMGHVMDNAKALIDVLMNDMETYRSVITDARAQSNLGWSEYGWEALVDFMSLVNLIGENAPDKEISDLSNSLLESLSKAVFDVGSSPIMEERAGGLSVYFPPSYDSFLNNRWWYGSIYGKMQFSEVWLKFLESYWNLR